MYVENFNSLNKKVEFFNISILFKKMIITLENSKETLKKLIDYLIKKTGKKQWELSLGAGYEKDTLTQMKSKHTGHEAVIERLKLIYKDSLKNSMYDSSKTYQTKNFEPGLLMEDENDIKSNYKNKYLNALEEIRELQKKLLEKKEKAEESNRLLKRAK